MGPSRRVDGLIDELRNGLDMDRLRSQRVGFLFWMGFDSVDVVHSITNRLNLAGHVMKRTVVYG